MLFYTFYIRAVARIYHYRLARFYEERNTNGSTCLYGSRFSGIGSRISFKTRFGISYGKLNLYREFGEKDSLGRSIRNNLYNHTFLKEVHAGYKFLVYYYVFPCLLIKEVVLIAFVVRVLVRTAFHTNILQFLADIETTFQNASRNDIFQFGTHYGIALARFNM